MKSFLLLFLAISILFAIYYFSFRDKVTSVSPGSIAQNVATTTSVMPTITADWIEQNKGNTAALPPGRVESHDTHNTYINESWGFTFNFPKDWELTEPAFGSGHSLFAVGINPVPPDVPHAISIEITPRSWFDRVLHQIRNDSNYKISKSTFSNKESIKVEGYIYESVPELHHLVLRYNLYWVSVGVVSGDKNNPFYSKQWGMVRDSFQFLE